MFYSLLSKLVRPKRDFDRLEASAIELFDAGRFAEAEACFREAVRARPASAGSWANLAVSLIRQDKLQAARYVLEQVIELSPGESGPRIELANVLWRSGEVSAAIAAYRWALDNDPQDPKAFANLFKPMMDICDWTGVALHFANWMRLVHSAPETVWAERMLPYVAVMLPMPSELRKAVAMYHSNKIRDTSRRMAQVRRAPHAGGKLRIGYVSADFGNHPTAHLTAEMYGLHDRESFEIYGYALAADDGSEYRRRIQNGCDHFVELLDTRSATMNAQRIADDGIDILVDLMGHTRGARLALFALRPAPVQTLHCAGYPGTTGADFVDYAIADRSVLPIGCEREFSEQPVFLPHTYLATDCKQPVWQGAMSRAELGLSETGFVFCCFNQPYKIDAPIFHSWARILSALPDSQIWLFAGNDDARANLTRVFEGSGISSHRLVFAAKLPKAQHLARLRLADLFLDTYTYNAHTTTVDALWAGLPVLTCTGGSFASRVATSLLRAIDMPELVTASLAEYEQCALSLARDNAGLEAIKNKLVANRARCPLFDTAGYVRSLESAYQTMWAIHASGQPPRTFEISD
jgi:predicted O-linked N-acetylglucosamine transferase (SPINDLY family)